MRQEFLVQKKQHTRVTILLSLTFWVGKFTLPATWGMLYYMQLNDGTFNRPKRIKLHTIYNVILQEIKQIQVVYQAAKFKFQYKFETLPVIPEDCSGRRWKVLT